MWDGDKGVEMKVENWTANITNVVLNNQKVLCTSTTPPVSVLKQDRSRTFNVTLKRDRVTTVAEEKQ